MKLSEIEPKTSSPEDVARSDVEFAERRRLLMLKMAAGAFAVPVVLKKMTAKAAAY